MFCPPTESRHVKLTEYLSLLCCGLVCEPHAYWLVYAQPLFLSLNSPLDHSASNSSSFSSSFHGPDLLAECQYLGRTPTCYHNDTLTHTKVSTASSQFKHQIHKPRTPKIRFFFSQSVSHHSQTGTSHSSHPLRTTSQEPPSACQPDIAVVWARCGPGSKGMRVFVFLPFRSSCDPDRVTHRTTSAYTTGGSCCHRDSACTNIANEITAWTGCVYVCMWDSDSS